MTKKSSGVAKAGNIAKVTEAKALAMEVAAKLNGKPTSKPKPKMDLDGLVKRANQPKPTIDRAAERRAFIKQNAATILKAWYAMPEGKRSAAALNKVLPGMRNKWIDEVLMLAGLRKSGEKVVIDAVAEDKPFLKDLIGDGKPVANGKLITREKKEAQAKA